jgi:hypothetical protein
MECAISKEEQNQFLDTEMQPRLSKIYKEYKANGDTDALEDGVGELYELAKRKELQIFQSKKKMINEIKKDVDEENGKPRIKRLVLKCCGAKLYNGEKCQCGKMEGFYLFTNVIDKTLEKKIISIMETDSTFVRHETTGKIFYQMAPYDFPEEWIELLNIIKGLHSSCSGFDYSLQLKYEKGVYFRAHYDSKKRWEEFIVGVNLKSTAELYFTKKDTKSVNVVIPPRSIYILSGDSRYNWRHGIKKVQDLRYSITFRKKTDFEKSI